MMLALKISFPKRKVSRIEKLLGTPQLPTIFSGNGPPISTTQGWKSRLGFQQSHPLKIGAQFEPRTGGIEPPTFCLQAWVPTNYAKFGRPAHPHKSVCYIATLARPPKSKLQNPKSKIQTGRLDFGFWSLDFGSWILDFGFWILDLGFWILDFGFRILDFGFWILDFGFWILDCRSIRSFCGSPKRGRLDFGFWILDFGSWILDFGFWILDFGSWILDFGFWILDFGFRILDFGFWILGTVWILHKIIATTRRLGSADIYFFFPMLRLRHIYTILADFAAQSFTTLNLYLFQILRCSAIHADVCVVCEMICIRKPTSLEKICGCLISIGGFDLT